MEGEIKPEASAHYSPVGYRPKGWVALVGDKALCDSRGGERRFSTEQAALSAARAAVETV
jgi:hypothetical protein